MNRKITIKEVGNNITHASAQEGLVYPETQN